MTEIQDPRLPGRDDVRLLLEDLACVAGTLSEIMTTWRRAMPGRPELPASTLLRIQDTTRQLAADIEARVGPGQGLNTALSMGKRFSALKEDVACARAATREPGQPAVGDRGLWERLDAAMRGAEARLTELRPGRVAVGGPMSSPVRSA
jgi:hypothetical protein